VKANCILNVITNTPFESARLFVDSVLVNASYGDIVPRR
jgi:hypothetical protein